MTSPIIQAVLTEEKRSQWRTRALKDLYWFAGVVLNYGDRVPIREGPHALFCKFVEKRTGHPALDGARYRKIELPREYGKTTLVTQAYVIQRICQDPDIAILIANEKEQNAKDFLSEIKHQFETNELLRALFPEIVPQDLTDTTWSASRIVVQRRSGRKEPTVSVIGVGGTVTGMHYDLIIGDDIISREAMENARAGSWQIMHQVNRWIHQLDPLLNSNALPFPEIIFIGCVAENERVLMADGSWLAIQLVQVGERVASWDATKKRFVSQTVTGVWPQGTAPTVVVSTNRHRVRVTANHPFLTDRGYIPASNLKIGERIWTVGSLTAVSHGRKTMIGRWRQASPDRLWMLGYLWGDGWVTKYVGKTRHRSTSWCVCAATGIYPDRNARILKALAREFGGRVYDSAFGYYRMDSNSAGRTLDALGLHPGVRAPDKRLPRWLWGMRPAEKRAFLRGLLDADGHHVKGQEYRLSTSSDGLANDVRLLALTCGVRPSRIWSRERETRAPHSKHLTVSAEHSVALVFESRRELRAQRVTAICGTLGALVYDLSVEGTENFVAEGFVVHNTRWWHKDSYEHIEEAFGYGDVKRPFLLRWKDSQTGAVQQITAYRQGDLAMFRRAAIEDGHSTFPEKWDLEKLAKIRVRDEALFACNYLNNPSDEVTAVFRESWLLYYEMLDDETYRLTDGTGAKRTYPLDDLDRLLFVDPGGFGTRANEDRARAAIIAVGSTGRGEHLLLDCYSEKDTFLACAEKVCEWVARFGPRKVVIEQAGQQLAFIEFTKKLLAEKGLTVTVEAVKPGTIAKEQRILLLEPLFQQGRMYLGRGPNFHEFRSQYSHFPRAARLDLLDALAYFPAFAKKQPRAPTDTAKRRADELQAYYASRGLTQPS